MKLTDYNETDLREALRSLTGQSDYSIYYRYYGKVKLDNLETGLRQRYHDLVYVDRTFNLWHEGKFYGQLFCVGDDIYILELGPFQPKVPEWFEVKFSGIEVIG